MNKLMALVGIICLVCFVGVFSFNNEGQTAERQVHERIIPLPILVQNKYRVTVFTKHPATNELTFEIEIVQANARVGLLDEYITVYRKAYASLKFPIKKDGNNGYIFVPAHAVEGLKIEQISH